MSEPAVGEAKPGHICVKCRQRIKWFRPRVPVKADGKTTGFRHAGCGASLEPIRRLRKRVLRRNNARARRERAAVQRRAS